MNDHGYTAHGHSLPGKVQHPENRPPVARCGGPIICSQCGQEVAEAFKQMFQPPQQEPAETHAPMQALPEPAPCIHYKHEHWYDHEGMHCTNCGKKLTILETLDPNEKWTITNDGKGNLTIEY